MPIEHQATDCSGDDSIEPAQSSGLVLAVLPKEPSNAKLALILGCMWVGVVLTAIDSTIVATLLVPISTTFKSLGSLAWLGSAYLIGQAASQPLCGRLTEIFGRRAGLIVANSTFGIGTLICGLANNEGQILFGRALAGLGGGAIYAVSTFVGSDLVPVRKRGVITGINNLCYGAGTGLGGLYGGWLNDVLGWKWAFLIQVPLIFVATVLVYFVVKVPTKKVDKSNIRRVDYLGCITLITALVLFLLGLNAGGNLVPWKSALVLTTLPLSIIFFALFLYIEKNVASEPIIPLHLLQNRTVLAASLTYCFDHMSAFGVLYYIPVYIQLLGYSTTQAGLRLLPNSAGQAVGALAAGFIMRAYGTYYNLSILTHLFTVVGSGLLIHLSLTTPSWYPFLILAIIGLGFGGMLVINLTAVISSVQRDEQALATSASFVFRSAGSTLGVTFASAVFQNVLKEALWSRLGQVADAGDIIHTIRGNFQEISHVDPLYRQDVLDSYMVALVAVFGTTFGMSCLAALTGLFMKEHKLHSNISRT
ncbi:related to MFS multidrug transporter [Phialocephala subalpina]|uniref:Related to MFS multidrug transporter n=1 Tax=Phialocephala subalpina TaxID=576137 RepID=A0A1L7XJF1_9HELO|nr:related to MFS multidrug transporter [Phialocephala subalpina]